MRSVDSLQCSLQFTAMLSAVWTVKDVSDSAYLDGTGAELRVDQRTWKRSGQRRPEIGITGS